MKIFISWSDEPSRTIASCLVKWLRGIVQAADPWMSEEGIRSGTRWRAELDAQLDGTNFGIVCLTHANQHAPWLMFEAGALADRLDSGCLVPLCIDMETADLAGPLSDRQAVKLNREGLLRLVCDINLRVSRPVQEDALHNLFDLTWPALEELIRQAVSSRTEDLDSVRTTEKMLEELLDRTKRLEQGYDATAQARLAVAQQERQDALRLGTFKVLLEQGLIEEADLSQVMQQATNEIQTRLQVAQSGERTE